MHLIRRELYDAALLVQQSDTQYEPGNPGHEALLASGIACIQPDVASKPARIVLTHKGEIVVGMD
jgi:hypothetical protein